MVKIALCQMEIIPSNPFRNFCKIKEFMKNAKEKKANLVVFPEKCNGILEPKNYLQKDTEEFLIQSQELCKEYKLFAVLGSILVKEKKNFFNRAYLIGDKGEIIGHYNKIRLINGIENKHTKKGNKLKVFKTPFGKIGIAICLDITDPIIFNKYKKLGAEIIICPSMWENYISWNKMIYYGHKIDTQKAAESVVKKITQVRAIENELFVIFCNAAGEFKAKGFSFRLYGRSSISEPLYGMKYLIDNNKECMIIGDIDKNMIKVASKYKLFY